MKLNGLLFLVLAIAIAAALLAKLIKGKNREGTFEAKPITTANEQAMFWRLVTAFPPPEYLVFAQVSFGALLKAKGGASRYSFSQKIADFVVTNKGFKVLAIIELDDSSHRGREKQDASRDAMLTQAGYQVLRYSNTPDKDKLQRDITKSK